MMDDAERRQVRTCIDRKVAPKSRGERMALVRASQWQAGDVIRAVFVNGEQSVQERVKSVALRWLDHANVNLYFVDSLDDVRHSHLIPGARLLVVRRH